jgi:hypothetical protein
LANGGSVSTVTEQLPNYTKVKGLNPEAADRKYGRVNYHKKIMLQKQCDELWWHSGRTLA